MPDCIFCKIAAGRIPCVRVFEDDVLLVFMDIGPLAAGHVLLVPKKHYELLSDMPPEEAAHVGSKLPALVRAVRAAVGAEGVNLLQNSGRASGQEVMHVHFHLIPRRPGDGLGYRWPAKKADMDILQAQAEAIRRNLKGSP
jgi:histidine triad (HIT) family protein